MMKKILIIIQLLFVSICFTQVSTISSWTYEPLQGTNANPTPNSGVSGTSGLVGMTVPGTATGMSGSGCGSQVSGQNAWAIGTANPGSTNETNGAFWFVSTSDYEDISVTWEQRWSGTAANTLRFQYTTDGSTWNNFEMTALNTTFCLGALDNGRFETNTTADRFRRITVDLSSILDVNENENFGFRIVAAHYRATNQFRQVQTPANTATGGTWRFDNVKIEGKSTVSSIVTSLSSFPSLFVYDFGDGPSSSNSFTINALNLENETGNISISAPAGYEISIDDLTFSDDLAISYSNFGENILNNEVHVRLKAGLDPNSYSGNLTLTSGTANAVITLLGGVSDNGLIIGSLNNELLIDFDNNLDGSNGSGFNASNPLYSFDGQANKLNSGAWSVQVNGTIGYVETQAAVYPSLFTSVVPRGVTTSTFAGAGLYGVEIDPGNKSLGFQPTAAFLSGNEGAITLRLKNETGSEFNTLNIEYDINIFNDEPRSNSMKLYFSADNITYTEVLDARLLSPAAADGSPTWTTSNKSTVISNILINDGSQCYLRWACVDESGSGNRDKFSIDNIKFKALLICSNEITSVSSNVRCGSGELTISALPSDFSSLKWYTSAIGGVEIVDDLNFDLSGNDLTISNLNLTSTFYVESVIGSCVSARTPVNAIINICTEIIPSQCNIVLGDNSSDIYCGLVPGATIYEFRLVNGATTLTIQKPSRTFKPSQVNGCLPGTTYQMSVRTFNSEWSIFGPACPITTRSASAGTKLQTSQCGITLTNVTTDLYADQIISATQYRFRVTNGASVQEITRASRTFKMSQLTTVHYGVTVTVEVDAFVNGAWIGYGAPCNITMPTLPTTKLQTSQCGITLTSTATLLYADPISGATQYRFRVKNGTIPFADSIVKTSRVFRMSEIPGLTVNTTYQVDVAVNINGSWQTYGVSCNVTTPTALAMMIQEDLTVENNYSELNDMKEIEVIEEEQLISGAINSEMFFVELSAYPNPNNGEFIISTSNEMRISIINELGQLMQSVILSKENNYNEKIHGLNPGIYFINGTSNNEIISKKVVIL
jgi:hypothetical protein